MTEYGELLDDNLFPEHTMFNDLLSFYFDNPKMKKIKNTKDHSVYIVKTSCLLTNKCRYIIVTTAQNDIPINTYENMENLQWSSLQTRTLDAIDDDIPSHSYTRKNPGLLNSEISSTKEDTQSITYSCDILPITITLLKTENNIWQKKGTIVAAIESFNTIITKNRV